MVEKGHEAPANFFLHFIHATLVCKANWGVEFIDSPASITNKGKEKQGNQVLTTLTVSVTCPQFRSGILHFPRMGS